MSNAAGYQILHIMLVNQTCGLHIEYLHNFSYNPSLIDHATSRVVCACCCCDTLLCSHICCSICCFLATELITCLTNAVPVYFTGPLKSCSEG